MSDMSSFQAPDQSISTDSEESFLIRQLNKSQTFNHSNSTNSSSSKHRKSYFRESFIDENGNRRSFSVYQDVINEDSTQSNDSNISCLSNFELLPNSSVLGELDNNHVPSSSSSDKNINKASPRRRSKILSSHKQFEPGSSTSSVYVQGFNSLNSPSFDGSNVSRIKTPDFPAPVRPPVHDLTNPNQTIQKSAEDITEQIYDSYINTESQPPRITSPKKKESNSSLSSSYKSARSDVTRQSILNLESSRKKVSGTPHLLLTSDDPDVSIVLHDNGGNFQKSDSRVMSGIVPIVEQYNNPSIASFDEKFSIREKKEIPITKGSEVLKSVKLKDLKEVPFKEVQNVSEKYHKSIRLSSDSSDLESNIPHRYNDQLLEKIYESRSQQLNRKGWKSDKLAWFLYAISFLVPPLFFFLGLGLLDSRTGRIDPFIKKLSLFTGVLVLLIALAMIGVGYGYGISSVKT